MIARTHILFKKIKVKNNDDIIINRYVLMVFFDRDKFSIPLVCDRESGELFVKLTSRTNAFKLLNKLLCKSGYKKLNKYKLFKFLEKAGWLYSLDVYRKIIVALYIDGINNQRKE